MSAGPLLTPTMAQATELLRVDSEWVAMAAATQRQGPWLRDDDNLVTSAIVPKPGGKTLWFSIPCYGKGPCPQQIRAAMASGLLPPRGAKVSVRSAKGKELPLRASDIVPRMHGFHGELADGALKAWAEGRGF